MRIRKETAGNEQAKRIEKYENIMREAQMMLDGSLDYDPEALRDMADELEAYYKTDLVPWVGAFLFLPFMLC